MLLRFCPFCEGIMIIQKSRTKGAQFTCDVCPIYFNTRRPVIVTHLHKNKEPDAIIDSEEVWKNAETTSGVTCPRCSSQGAYFTQIQTRSADEPMTIYYRCCNHSCSYYWRDD